MSWTRILSVFVLTVLLCGAAAAEGGDHGPDELFPPWPKEGLYEGQPVERAWKYVVLRVPNPDGADRPEDDLPRRAKTAAGGVRLMLDQRLAYMPQLYEEQEAGRVMRYHSWLRNRNVPRVGESADNSVNEALEEMCRRFNADYLFLLNFRAAPVGNEDDKAEPRSMGCVYRYRRGVGVEARVDFELLHPGGTESDSLVQSLHRVARDVTRGIGAQTDEDGNVVEIPHAPVPPLVKRDSTLELFVRLVDAMVAGELTEAWVSWEDLMRAEPSVARAALWGMEMFKALADQKDDFDEAAPLLQKSIKAGVTAAAHAPNDLTLRAYLCWNAMSFYGRIQWAKEGLRQGLRVQPGHFKLISLLCRFENWDSEDREPLVEALIERGLPNVRDGRVELEIGHTYFNSVDLENGVKWYRKAVELMPGDHEANLSLGLCANYLGESLARATLPGEEGAETREQAEEAFALAATHLWRAIEIDPQDTGLAYRMYPRAATRRFTWLPNDPEMLDRIFLIHAALFGLQSSSQTREFDRIAQPLMGMQRRLTRAQAHEAQPGDRWYETWLIARLQFAMADDDSARIIRALWQMKNHGMRPAAYEAAMRIYGPLVDAYDPDADE